jgi:hypothetical protein
MARRLEIREGECGVALRAKVTEEGLLIPKAVAERAFGEGSEAVEIFEEPGRLLISPAGESDEAGEEGEDPILALGEDPVEDPGTADASVNHDRYLYTGG